MNVWCITNYWLRQANSSPNKALNFWKLYIVAHSTLSSCSIYSNESFPRRQTMRWTLIHSVNHLKVIPMEPTHHWIQSALKVHSRKEQQQYQQTAIQFLMKEDTLLYTLIAESGRDFFKFFKASTAWFLSAQHCLLFLTVLIRALVCRRPKFNCVSLTITFPSTPRTVF